MSGPDISAHGIGKLINEINQEYQQEYNTTEVIFDKGPDDVTVNIANANATTTPVHYRSVQSTTGTDATPKGLYLRPNGTQLFVVDEANDEIESYTLSTPYDLSTIGASTTALTSRSLSVYFKHDGTKMYEGGGDNSYIREYDLSTAWDITSNTLLQTFTGMKNKGIKGMHITDDGEQLFTVEGISDRIFQYSFGTPWDASTLSFTKSTSMGALDSAFAGCEVSKDGKRLYVGGSNTDSVFVFRMPTPFDVGVLEFVENLGISATNATGISLTDEEERLYISTEYDPTGVTEWDKRLTF